MTLRWRAALVLAGAAGAASLLAALPLPVPTRLAWADLDRWYLEVGPAVAAMAALRLAAQVGCGWLAVASILQLLVAGGRRPHLARRAHRLTPRFLRSVACSAGLSLSAGVVVLPVPLRAGGPPPGTAVMVPLDVTTTTARPTTTEPTTSTSPSTTTTTTAPTASPEPAPRAPAAHPRDDEVVVARGDSFWSIAADEHDGDELVGYWRALIERNRDRLVDPSNPDLLFPGQVLRLP